LGEPQIMSRVSCFNDLTASSTVVCDNRLKAAKATIRNLQEELQKVKDQLELLVKENEELERLSITDELTGLYNQRRFHNVLDQEVINSSRQGHSLCLLFFDVDSLKTYNDTYGHIGGNNVLKAVARSLSQNINKDADSGYRYGGDEFAIILPKTHVKQAVEVAKGINRSLWKTDFQHITLSYGIAEFKSEMDSRMLFRNADEAMYMAKKLGANESYIFAKIYVYGFDVADLSAEGL